MIRERTSASNETGLLVQAVEGSKDWKLHKDNSVVAVTNKAFAMFLFNSGACDLVRTQTAFDMRPHWREA